MVVKKAGGGEANFGKPRDDAKEEESSKPARRNNAPKIEDAAEEKAKGGAAKAAGGAARAAGGRAKRKRGGKANMSIGTHHEAGENMKHAKHLGKVHGEQKFHAGKAGRATGGAAKATGGVAAKAAGGRAAKASGGSNFSPLSSAHKGTAPRDHKVTELD